jgi:cytochrome c oxidase subunit IV
MSHHDPSHSTEHAHPGAKEYLGIAAVLVVITAIEVAVFYIPSMKPVLVPVLLTLSALKFALVAMFYMHLKFDHKLFSWLFVVPMMLATIVILALMRLFGVW